MGELCKRRNVMRKSGPLIYAVALVLRLHETACVGERLSPLCDELRISSASVELQSSYSDVADLLAVNVPRCLAASR